MASTPSFAVTPRIAQAAVTTAETSMTSPTSAATIITAPASGTRVNRIQVFQTATGSAVATMIRLFLHDGTNYKGLIAEVPLTALNPSASQKASTSTLSEVTNPDILPLVLPNGWSIRATTHVTGTFGVSVQGADL